IVDWKIGSVMTLPAGPSAGSAGFAYVVRSVTARYGPIAVRVGPPDDDGGGGGVGFGVGSRSGAGGVAAAATESVACVIDAPAESSDVSRTSGKDGVVLLV